MIKRDNGEMLKGTRDALPTERAESNYRTVLLYVPGEINNYVGVETYEVCSKSTGTNVVTA